MGGMDHQVVNAKIQEYAEAVPPEHREEFVQDMWVLILDADLPEVAPNSNLTSLLNITLFRARDNWLDRRRYRDSKQEESDTRFTEDSPSPSALQDIAYEAEESLANFVASLNEFGNFTEEEVQTIADGLRDGLTQKEIASSLGRTPQALHYHVKRCRIAA